MRVDRRRKLVWLSAVLAAALFLAARPSAVMSRQDVDALRAGVTVGTPAYAAAGSDAGIDPDAGLSQNRSGVGNGSWDVAKGVAGIDDANASSGDGGGDVGRRRLIPGGQSVGVAIRTAGVIVVGASDLGNTPSPARLAGIRMGDVIRRVNGQEVDSAEALSRAIGSSERLELEIERRGATRTLEVEPAIDPRDGRRRLGAWVRDSTAGIGTMTYFDPQTSAFGALGHAISDADSGIQLPVGRGELFENAVIDVTPGEEGAPGELTGDFIFGAASLGTVEINSESGIFGHVGSGGFSILYPQGLPIARRAEIHTGGATLLTTIDGEGVKAYECEIERLNDRARPGERAMVVRITDSGLLARTGGIVQGMSGSPILQDGRLIGAVTHVMVNDPAMGYGIDIESMLEAESALSENGMPTAQSERIAVEPRSAAAAARCARPVLHIVKARAAADGRA